MNELKNTQNESKATSTEIGPYKTLFIKSMPFERKCAAIENKTITSMQRNDIGEVAYRYLQARKK